MNKLLFLICIAILGSCAQEHTCSCKENLTIYTHSSDGSVDNVNGALYKHDFTTIIKGSIKNAEETCADLKADYLINKEQAFTRYECKIKE